MKATLEREISLAVDAVRHASTVEPEIALILGTGLGRLAEVIDVEDVVPYERIPGFPTSTVESHAGRLLLGRLSGKTVAAMQGRFHRYEGYDLDEVTFPVRTMRALGAKTLLVSNACGGMLPEWQAGDLMLITDHVNLLGDNPLVGLNLDAMGPRFPDMSQAYDPALRALTLETAAHLGITLRQGVYAGVPGPNLETRAEYRMLRAIGADAVGMSTVPEVVVARHAGMRVLGLSIVTDMCLPESLEPVSVEHIIAVAQAAEPNLSRLVAGVAERMG